MTEEECEADDLRRQDERFRPVEHTYSQRGHVLAVMSCAGREALLQRTLASLKADDWIGPKMIMMDGRAFIVRPVDWWLFHPSARLDSRVGQARTFFETLKVASQFPNFSYLTLFEDDVVVAENALNYIATMKYPNGVAMVSWFHQLATGDEPRTTWVIDSAKNHSCNQSITLPAATVRALLDSSQLKSWSNLHGADVLIGQVMPDARVAYHFPNIVDHIGGDHSLVGNTGARRSPTFVGETFDALDLTR